MTDEVHPASFRDPSGVVFRREGRLLRQVNRVFRPHYDQLMASGLYEALVGAGLLIPHEEIAEPGVSEEASLVIRPQRLGFVSYPYEWCFGQLRDAAAATLRIQRMALDHGMSLRDATAYNIQFRDGRPILIDTLSFERLREGRPWIAYRQFCQHFLAPLALMAYRDVRLGQLLRVHLDGIPLDLAAGLLPRRARMRPPLLLHLVSHARAQQRHAGSVPGEPRDVRISARGREGILQSLEAAVRGLRWEPGRSTWSDYYGESGSYPETAFEHKRALVETCIADVRPKEVWDLGGNVGVFARIASERGIPTVCFDADPTAVELNHRRIADTGERNLLPLVQDLTNPSPSIGLEHRERASLQERGPADLGLALALVHHLAIANNVPLSRLAAMFEGLCRTLLVEFVPKEDPKVQVLLAGREDIFPRYTAKGFERAFSQRFEILRRAPIRDSVRVLYLMEARIP